MNKSKSFLAPFDGLMSSAGKARTMFIINRDISSKAIVADPRYLECFQQSYVKQTFGQSKINTDQLVAQEMRLLAKQEARRQNALKQKQKNTLAFTNQTREKAYIVHATQYRREKVPPQGHYQVNYDLVKK
jgi:hypothetical protein